MRKLIFNVHLFLALMVGAFMVILGVTGSIMEFEPELDQYFHANLCYVVPGKHALSLSEIGDSVSRKFSGEAVVAYLPSIAPNLSTRVLLPRGMAYVNQYTGEVLGLRPRGQSLLGFARALHVRLATGDFGRIILKWSGIGMLLSLASGLYLWWPIKRFRIGGQWGSRRVWFDIHNAVGIFTFLPLVVLATTGTVLGFEDQLGPLIYRMTGSHPLQVHRAPAMVPEGASQITPDQAVATALVQMPGAVPYRVQMPTYGGTYQIAFSDSRNRITGDRNIVGLDRYGNVVSLVRSSDLSRGDRILAMNEAIHTGNVFGTSSRVAASLVSIMVFLQAFSGLLMWRYRSKTSTGRSTGEGRV